MIQTCVNLNLPFCWSCFHGTSTCTICAFYNALMSAENIKTIIVFCLQNPFSGEESNVGIYVKAALKQLDKEELNDFVDKCMLLL
jgi:hypothetical protein